MVSHLSEQFWEERYLSGQTGWDMGMVSPPLQAYIDQLDRRDISILIPGCGNAYEAVYLAEKGFERVTVVDIATAPLKNLQQKLERLGATSIDLVHADFFDLQGKYDLLLEQTFFCAVNPDMRASYVRHACELLSPDGVLAGVLFASHFEKEGPPYGGTAEEYRVLFSRHFVIDILAPCHNSHPKRMGNELFIRMHPRNEIC